MVVDPPERQLGLRHSLFVCDLFPVIKQGHEVLFGVHLVVDTVSGVLVESTLLFFDELPVFGLLL